MVLCLMLIRLIENVIYTGMHHVFIIKCNSWDPTRDTNLPCYTISDCKFVNVENYLMHIIR